MNRDHEQKHPAPLGLVARRRNERRAIADSLGRERRANLPVVPESVEAFAEFDAIALADPTPNAQAAPEVLPGAYRLTYACSAAGPDSDA